MPRPQTDLDNRRLIWERILEAAMRHHGRKKRYGMQKVISADSGMGEAAVSKWAKAKSRPEDKTLRALADLYQVSAAWLSGVEEEPRDYGPPDELLRRAADITELVVTELIPSGTPEQFIRVLRRAQDLLLEGMSDHEVRGQLFLEVSRSKRDCSQV